ncbi:hypothetical protein CW684_10760 [Macrococcoides caseolyticum]|uniref:hypothetical protein n=1 Tax=Macrococcoides caseolyticum TaxID=69966 RepID=UPI000C321518|nr:hypothetical protein [Macrococcus caseolyticus]PKE48731.1 hypothetical protein CW672_10615 [Macrococcus caseolyticus]PKE64531.1 hypothetical protein CW674_11565 [Macrococcus caseolyticus]PKE71294.1 hypothetical protein CW665_11285 [Macrococcus caseolyticus]PKF20455.1 hypothetical protein CW684_10760 [Macrococcus caseolyticus]PKF32751.1 hypothetical protein CW687_10515 [Macrococcus caseolyticus]
MKTNKDVILISLSIFIGALLVQFIMSFVTTNSIWEWSEISNRVIPFSIFMIFISYVSKEYSGRKHNKHN